VFVIPAEFSTYLRYTRQLDFFETPDYNYVRGLFTGLMSANGWQCDWDFDWTSRHAVRLPLLFIGVSVWLSLTLHMPTKLLHVEPISTEMGLHCGYLVPSNREHQNYDDCLEVRRENN